MHILLLILYIQLVICSTSTRSDSVGAALRLLGVVRLLMAAAQEAAQEAAQQLETLETLSCKNLKQVLAAHNVGFEGVVEKEELIRLARRALGRGPMPTHVRFHRVSRQWGFRAQAVGFL